METTSPAEIISAKIEAMLEGPYTGSTGAGEPLRRGIRIVNGHRVVILTLGFDDRVVIEMDSSTEPLTVEEAAERCKVAA